MKGIAVTGAVVALGALGGLAAFLFVGKEPPRRVGRGEGTVARAAEPAAERFVKVWVGDAFPDFEVRSLDGTRTFRLSRDRDPGKFTVINFHSPDCPCAANCAALINEMAKAGDADYEIVGILAGKPMDADFYARTRAQVAEGVAAFPLYDDADGTVRALAGAKRTPTVWVLDRGGRVAYVGAPENTLFPGSPGHRYLLREALEALRTGRTPEPQSFAPLGCPIDPTEGN